MLERPKIKDVLSSVLLEFHYTSVPKSYLTFPCCVQNYLDAANRNARHSDVSSAAYAIQSRLHKDIFVHLGFKTEFTLDTVYLTMLGRGGSFVTVI